jgi:hypothetical protein
MSMIPLRERQKVVIYVTSKDHIKNITVENMSVENLRASR